MGRMDLQPGHNRNKKKALKESPPKEKVSEQVPFQKYAQKNLRREL
jgi:hypothetical protein